MRLQYKKALGLQIEGQMKVIQKNLEILEISFGVYREGHLQKTIHLYFGRKRT